MRSIYQKYLPDKDWRVDVHGWDKDSQGMIESKFTLGNGFIGSRGILEETPFDAHVGTYMAGVFDRMGAKVADLVNLPNPLSFKLSVGGEKLDVSTMPHVSHKRCLDLKHGVLLRHTVYEAEIGCALDYQSVRFFSMKDKNIGVMRVYVTPLNKPCSLTVSSSIDTSVSNVSGISEGRRTHFRISEVEASDETSENYLAVQTFTGKVEVAYGSILEVSDEKKTRLAKEEDFILNLKKSETACFTKIFAICPKYPEEPFDLKAKTLKAMRRAASLGFKKLLREHCDAWEKRWQMADIKIKASGDIQRNMRFCVYHLLIAGIDDKGRSSIGAKTLSGEGYRGHVFWDSELFMFPFFLYTNPDIAKSMILYRIKRLDQARELAVERGYAGAMFPWESAYTGYEETPSWARDLDGSIIKIRTHEMECHITADIAYALYRYYIAAEDEDIMLNSGGYELLFETARFWVSRGKFGKKRKRFSIRKVIGPDEFHERVNNNAFTNMMARWNIFIAYSMYIKMRKKYPSALEHITRKIGLSEKEIKKWHEVIRKLKLQIRKDRVILQFDGFLKRKKVKITELDDNFMPMIPRRVKLDRIGQYQILKQADVIMVLYLFPDLFDIATKKINYNFYAPITVHKSSLSPSIHSIAAAELGYTDKAFRYFMTALNSDVEDLHRNTTDGIHAANLGGVWQAMIHGFAGMRILKDTLSFNPKLPSEIKEISFQAAWKGFVFSVSASAARLKIKCWARKTKKKSIKVRVVGRVINMVANKTFVFSKGRKEE